MTRPQHFKPPDDVQEAATEMIGTFLFLSWDIKDPDTIPKKKDKDAPSFEVNK